MIVSGMSNSLTPVGRDGLLYTDLRDLEAHPRGALASRRGFQPYTSTVVTDGNVYDLAVFDRYSGSTRKIDLVARVVVGSTARLYHSNIFNGTAESTGNAWATMSTTAWTTNAAAGQFAQRNEYLYYSDRSAQRGYNQPSTPFPLGLTTPTGTLAYGLKWSSGGTWEPTRQEPGYYDWTVVGYHLGRNVRSAPLGFATSASKIPITGQSTQVTAFYSIVGVTSFKIAPTIRLATGSTKVVTLDSKATHWELYRRHPMDLYVRPARRIDDVRLVSRQSTASTNKNDRLNDLELGDRLTYAGSTPPAWRAACPHGDRWLYISAAEPWKIYFSEPDAPENVAQEITVDNHQIKPFLMAERGDLGNTGEGWLRVPAEAGPIQALVPLGEMTLVLCANQTWAFGGTSPTNFGMAVLDEAVGCVSPKSAVSTPFGAFWWSQHGLVWAGRGGGVRVLTDGVLDFDGAGSAVRLQRNLLDKTCAAYDGYRQQALFALPRYGSSGNDMVLVLDLGTSHLPEKPFFTWHLPTLASGEYVQSMTAVSLPTRTPFVAFGTNKGRVLNQDDAKFTDHNATSSTVNVRPRIRGWFGCANSRTSKTNLSLRVSPEVAFPLSISSSVWSRKTSVAPPATATPDSAATIACSATLYGGQNVGVSANPFAFFSLSYAASSQVVIHELAAWGIESPDFPRADSGKRLG